MTFPIIFLIVGLVILIFSAEILVRGSASLAKRMGISPLVIGLTIVAFGTSAPELIVNIFSAINGNTDIAIGNIIGSNIANILLILGVAAIITTLQVHKGTTWKEIPFALLAVVLVYTFSNDGLFDNVNFNSITRTDGFSLISLFIIFLYYIFALAKQNSTEGTEKITTYTYSISIILTIGGITGLFFGGKLLVDNAVIIAKTAGLSEMLIGLTIVAVGTSLPELATSVVAAYHKHSDIAVGNVVGSNIFNVFWILGITSIIKPLPSTPANNFDFAVAIIATFLLFLAMFVGQRHKLERWQGILFILLYIGYIGYIIQRG